MRSFSRSANSLTIRRQLAALDASNKQAAEDLQNVIGWIGGLASQRHFGPRFSSDRFCRPWIRRLRSRRISYGSTRTAPTP